ncbi:hypothetical protein PR003_g21815 [Phytophthora rubi]|uniref:Secreted protein n=1 Tax=Phytophthora rubi TaxID=129364 RepID=A0A6A3J8N1_9STRA|nr:hypothetical protein PR002_g21083 [Phytophthora rubi]KAE9035116.1 hypothetical protein PR001_g9439 [Phytophthora rubi]KAE9304158.1 hypothetical protein PR003_g21815 [Phytophthora rubi]
MVQRMLLVSSIFVSSCSGARSQAWCRCDRFTLPGAGVGFTASWFCHRKVACSFRGSSRGGREAGHW